MSTRATIRETSWFHLFRETTDGSIAVDVGRGAYNRAWRVWPPSRFGTRVY